MGKLITSIGIMSGMVLFVYFGGILTDTANAALLSLLLNPEGLQLVSLVTKVIGSLELAITLFTLVVVNRAGVNADQYLMIPLVFIFLNFAWDFVRVYQTLASYGPAAEVLGVLMFGPFLLMYIVAVVEWWRGVAT